MSDDYDAYELERQKTIQENESLLAQLGLDHFATVKRSSSHSARSSSGPRSTASKRKGHSDDDDDELRLKGPSKRSAPQRVTRSVAAVATRKSSRILGLTATSEEDLKKVQQAAEEEKIALAEERREAKKARGKQMKLEAMIDDKKYESEESIAKLNETFAVVSKASNRRVIPEAGSDRAGDKEDERLKEKFQGVRLKAYAKVTNERVYSMVVHPEPTKSLVFVGDKRGQLGIWDAEAIVAETGDNQEVGTGSVWRIQLHASASISCLKIDPTGGHSLFSSSYDCSLRQLDFATGQSTERFALDDEDALINHFDLTPSGQEAWLVDSQGGLSHMDVRDNRKARYEISGERANRKIGGVSINPINPWLVCTASNDRLLRIWDIRHLSKLKMQPYTLIDSTADEDVSNREFPQLECDYEQIQKASEAKTSKGILRGTSLHGKSCSSAYWDPWGRRILTTSYDDRLRIFDTRPEYFTADAPMAKAPEAIIKTIHDCQTGRWVSVFKAQWSLNTEYGPHYSVGSMKRRICIYSGLTGKHIAQFYDPTYVSSVPAVTALHPTNVSTVVGGNMSGKCHLWGE